MFKRPKQVYLDLMRDPAEAVRRPRTAMSRPSRAAKVPVAELRGLIVMNEPRRIYHYEHVAGQLLGVTGVEHTGLKGLEMQYDRWLGASLAAS
ncbi:MAG: hypothetical protein IPI01_17525 [Ignavibacteriae bacterium]|nr:hypothetical protein [Ignavibacteriota bacterium]